MSRPEIPNGLSPIAVNSERTAAKGAVASPYQAETPPGDFSMAGCDDPVTEKPAGADGRGNYAIKGAEAGACFGWLIGVWIGVGFLIFPGLGLILVKGSISAALHAGIEWGVAGALVGGLVGVFIGRILPKNRSSSTGRM